MLRGSAKAIFEIANSKILSNFVNQIYIEVKRKNIKDSTIYIIVFCVVAFAAICIFRPREKGEEKKTAIATVGDTWIDTLTNKSSDFEPLFPMENEIERFMSKWDIKGMSIAVSRNDSLIYTKGFGWADRERGERMEANSIMRIASASKLVTAATIMKLVEDGKLSLQSHVFGSNGLLNRSDFTDAIRDSRMENITIEHLLRHQGGFTLGAGDPMFNTVELKKAKHLTKAPTNEELIKIVLGRRLGFEPGNGRRYSNFGYMLLSMVIEKVSGQNYWDYVRQNILEPAGAYGFMPATNYYTEKNPREVKYYSPDAELVEDFNTPGKMVDRCYGGANISALMGAGGWCTSAAALCRLVAAVDGDPQVKDVLKPESVAQMTAYQEKEKICFGWTDSDANGKWSRSGTLSSAHALIERFPDGECWVITMNSGVWTGFRFTRDMSRLIERLRSRYSFELPSRNLW